MDTIALANIIGYIAAIVGTVMFLPQVIRSWKTKHTKDISFISYSLLAASTFLWIIYGVLMNAYPIIFVNAVICILSIFLLILKRKYG